MIEELRIRDLGVIEDAVLPLRAGLTVLTGETGAGKTMVLTALGLLLGARADAAVVRSGAARADVEGRVSGDGAARVADRVADSGGHLDEDGSLLLARSVAVTGRGRAAAGGRGVPTSMLADLGADLVAVHGQHDQVRLLSPARQREALDRLGADPVAHAATDYRRLLADVRATAAELAEVVGHERERAREAERLRAGLAAVDRVAPVPGEDESLAAEADRLGHVEALREAAAVALAALAGDESVAETSDSLSALAVARRVLEVVRGVDPDLDATADAVSGILATVTDVAADLASYVDQLDVDPGRLEQVQQRRADLRALRRAYGDTVDEVLAWAARARDDLAHLDDEGRADALRARLDGLHGDVRHAASRLSAARRAAAERLSAAVNAELPALAMDGAELVVDIATSADGDPAAWAGHGIDEVSFGLRRPGDGPDATARPVARAASGGELSRLMLALELALAGDDPLPTMVFDEVDAGVGGAAALEIGRRLRALGRRTQVVVVTHLPQVAAFADHHLVVTRRGEDGVRASDVVEATGEERVRELARMLAGLADSRAALSHARELLDLAAPRAPARRASRAG